MEALKAHLIHPLRTYRVGKSYGLVYTYKGRTCSSFFKLHTIIRLWCIEFSLKWRTDRPNRSIWISYNRETIARFDLDSGALLMRRPDAFWCSQLEKTLAPISYGSIAPRRKF